METMAIFGVGGYSTGSLRSSTVRRRRTRSSRSGMVTSPATVVDNNVQSVQVTPIITTPSSKVRSL